MRRRQQNLQKMRRRRQVEGKTQRLRLKTLKKTICPNTYYEQTHI